jgi:hypothetical protein
MIRRESRRSGTPVRRRLSLVVLALAAALLLAAPAAQSIVFGHPDGARHPFVGMAFQTGADAACSGTLITDRLKWSR